MLLALPQRGEPEPRWVGTSPPLGPALGTGHLQSLLGTLNAEALQAPPSTPSL